ncbi:MAG TPA: SPOR domain-containing protein [Candidatus Sumerlaeota bacterium]|nr:SPOR domain-containing protein [Candidatus Sumerlaeota bacterium]
MSLRIRFLTLLLLVVCFSTARANATLYSHSFSGPEGRPSDGWQFDTTDPGYWTQHDGWLASGNGKDQVVQADGYSYAVINTPDSHGWDNYEVRTRFWMKPASGELALVGRWTDRQNHYRAVLKVGQGSRSVQLQKVEKGQTSQLASQPVKLDQLGVATLEKGTPDKAVDFAFSLNGPDLAVSLAGKPVVSAQDSSFAAGTAGFGQSQNDVYFSDIQVAQATVPVARTQSAARASSGGVYSVQLYRGTDIAFATALVRELKVKGYMPMLVKEDGEVRVMVGRFGSQSEAARMKQVMIINEDYAFASVQDVSASAEIGTAATAQPDEQKTKEMVDNTLKNIDLNNLTPEQQQKVLDTVVKWRANRMSLQSVESIIAIKQDVTKMTEEQKKSLEKLDEKVAQAANLGAEFKSLEQKVESQNPIERVNQALKESQEKDLIALKVKAEEASKGDNYDEALTLWLAVASKAAVDNPAMTREASTEIKKLQATIAVRSGSGGGAAAPASSGNTNLYLMIGGAGFVVLAVLLFLVFQSNRKRYQSLMLQMQQGGGRGPALREPAGMGGAALGSAGMDAGALDFPGGDELGLLDQTDTSVADFMIPEKPAKSAQKPVEDESSLFPEMDAEPLSLDGSPSKPASDDGGMSLDFGFGAEEKEESGSESVGFDFADSSKETPEESEPAGFSFAATEETSGAGDSFGFDFGAGDSEKEEPGKSDGQDFGFFGFDETPATGGGDGSAPMPEMAPAVGGGDDMGFTFDFGGGSSSSGDLDTQGAITASVFPTDDQPTPSVSLDDDLAFSFHDAVAESKATAPVEEEEEAPEEHEPLSLDFGSFGTVEEKKEKPAPTEAPAASAEDSLSLGDLTFNIAPEEESSSPDTAPTQALPSELYSGSFESPFAETPSAFPETPSFAMGVNPLMDDGLDFGVSSVQTAAPEATAPTIKLDQPAQPLAPGVLFAQDFASDPVGQIPSGWQGEPVADAALTVAEDPDGSGEKCLLFQKTGETAGTSFSCHFKEVRGNLVIEYDIRCDEKNKHLLGLYVEADKDFRRSVHTVVQCTDPSKPAHLRVFTQPADYAMGQWAHIKYVVDLGEGLVDGYVDDQLVAEGVRMGTRTPVLNTLSIRDSKNTTGTLYVKNVVIRQG